ATWLLTSDLLNRSKGITTQINALRFFQPYQIDRSPPVPLEVSLEVCAQGRVWWIICAFSTHGSALKDIYNKCGREDSNLQPVSRPNPKSGAYTNSATPARTASRS